MKSTKDDIRNDPWTPMYGWDTTTSSCKTGNPTHTLVLEQLEQLLSTPFPSAVW